MTLFYTLSALWYERVRRSIDSESEPPIGDMRGVLIADGLALISLFDDAKYYIAAWRQVGGNPSWRHIGEF